MVATPWTCAYFTNKHFAYVRLWLEVTHVYVLASPPPSTSSKQTNKQTKKQTHTHTNKTNTANN